MTMADAAGSPIEHQQPSLITALKRRLGNQLGRQFVMELRGLDDVTPN